ncbi:MAG: hypothetical protein K0S23_760 [Fluviicola sp.]|jgi:hypothetical protein|nr:hypothetical protein [Fluviicola sp.]
MKIQTGKFTSFIAGLSQLYGLDIDQVWVKYGYSMKDV